jgi:plasmid stabilization system protein ParE
MAKKKIEIIWSEEASNNFLEILEYLFSKSESAVSIVGNSILDEIEKLPQDPFIYPIDRFRKKKVSNYRAFIVYSYRISYYVSDTSIHILRVRHTSREPLES